MCTTDVPKQVVTGLLVDHLWACIHVSQICLTQILTFMPGQSLRVILIDFHLASLSQEGSVSEVCFQLVCGLYHERWNE